MIERILAFSLSLVTENLACYINTVRLYNFKLKWGGGREGEGWGGGKGVEGEGRGVSTAPFQRGREGEGGVENLLPTFLTTYWQSKTIVTN